MKVIFRKRENESYRLKYALMRDHANNQASFTRHHQLASVTMDQRVTKR